MDQKKLCSYIYTTNWIGVNGFLLWVVVKDKDYSKKYVAVRQLKNFIDDVFKEIRSKGNLCTFCMKVLGKVCKTVSMPNVDILSNKTVVCNRLKHVVLNETMQTIMISYKFKQNTS